MNLEYTPRCQQKMNEKLSMLDVELLAFPWRRDVLEFSMGRSSGFTTIFAPSFAEGFVQGKKNSSRIFPSNK